MRDETDSSVRCRCIETIVVLWDRKKVITVIAITCMSARSKIMIVGVAVLVVLRNV
jgi:hypothetical protein